MNRGRSLLEGAVLPLGFLLFMTVATGVLAAHAGRDEIRVSPDPIWRAESFAVYSIFVALILLPTTLYFYVFYGDWFLFYWVDVGRAPWFWGVLVALLIAGAAVVGFRLGSMLSRGDREKVVRRSVWGLLVLGFLVWPAGWGRLSKVGSYRQFNHDYGLQSYFASPTFYSGLLILGLVALSFMWIMHRIGQRTQEVV